MVGIYPDKSFARDIQILHKAIEEKRPFTLSKFADGEWMVMENKDLDNREFQYRVSDGRQGPEFTRARDALIDSFRYQHPQYYVGISCPCCQGDNFERMIKFSKQPKERLTWANIWVNTNYGYFLGNILPEFKNYEVHLVANEAGHFGNIPFPVKMAWLVSNNAWVEDWDMIENLCTAAKSEQGALFLFCCGPFGNILAHKLTEASDKNTYLDIGSTLNPFLKVEGFKRGYFNSWQSRNPCTWGEVENDTIAT